jgi:hypothetical protein
MFVRKVKRPCFLSVLFVTAGLSGQTPEPGSSLQSERHGCSVAEPNIDGNTDVYGLKEYKEAIADLPKQQKFDDLDCIGHAARSEKTSARWVVEAAQHLYRFDGTHRPCNGGGLD